MHVAKLQDYGQQTASLVALHATHFNWAGIQPSTEQTVVMSTEDKSVIVVARKLPEGQTTLTDAVRR